MSQSTAIRFSRFGAPEVLEFVDVEVGTPGPGQACIEHTAIGLNMIDTYFRSGLYEIALPSGLGSEAAGVVTSVGEGVSHIAPGQRVAYAAPPPLDAYAQSRLIDAHWLVGLPDGVDDRSAAAMMLKGMTAWYLLHRSFAVSAGDHVLLYAAAGGVGQICARWANALGAHVIGVVGSEKKRSAALDAGCESVLLSSDAVAQRVAEITSGQGVAAVYDSIGKDTFLQSLDCLRPHGVMVSFGNASGAVEPFSLRELMLRGSLYVTRPSLFDFIRKPDDLAEASQALFDAMRAGTVRAQIGNTYALCDVAVAHADLEGRRTTGSCLLTP